MVLSYLLLSYLIFIQVYYVFQDCNPFQYFIIAQYHIFYTLKNCYLYENHLMIVSKSIEFPCLIFHQICVITRIYVYMSAASFKFLNQLSCG